MTINHFNDDLYALIKAFEKSPVRNVLLILPDCLNRHAVIIQLLALADNPKMMGAGAVLLFNNRVLTLKNESQFNPAGKGWGDVYLFDFSHYDDAEELCQKISVYNCNKGAMCLFGSYKND